MDVSCSETKFACAGFEDDSFLGFGVVGSDELFCDVLGSVGGTVVYDYYFPVEGAVQLLGGVCYWIWMDMAYFSVKVLLSSQTMMGRFLRSLKVGKSTEYLLLTAIVAVGLQEGMVERSVFIWCGSA